MTKYKLEDFKKWLKEKPGRKASLEWDEFFSKNDFTKLVGWAEENKDDDRNRYQQQYQKVWEWKSEIDQRERRK